MEIEILHEPSLLFWCQRIRMPAGTVEALSQVATEVRNSPDLLALFTSFHTSTALRGEWHTDWSPLPFDPQVESALGQRTSLFYLLAYIAALPYTWKEYQRLGIDSQIFEATQYDLSFYTAQDSDVHGYWCFDHFMWVWRHLTCKLFRLGRLQFMLSPYDGHATAFRSRENGEILLLCGSSIPLRPDGYAHGAGSAAALPEDETTWHAVFEETGPGWRGNPISPYGYTLHETIFLPRSTWDRILSEGDTILDLHIPRGQSLTTQECRDSFIQAFDFFHRLWPEQTITAVFCHTWFFTPQLQTLLPPTSSIVQFQREFYLYPHPGGPSFLWSFVFGEKYPTPATAPRDTSLRRAVLDWLAEGKELFDLPGLMFHPPHDWGYQPYMGNWDRKSKEL